MRELFTILPLRGNKEELARVVREQKAFHRLDRETMEVISIMTNNRKILDDMDRYESEEGLEEGLERGEARAMKLNVLLLEAGRLEDLRRAAEDRAYRSRLYLEFEL